jgi:hypothetical protein
MDVQLQLLLKLISEDGSKPMPRTPFKAFIDFLDPMKRDIIVSQYNQTVPAIFNGWDRDPYRVLYSSDSLEQPNTPETRSKNESNQNQGPNKQKNKQKASFYLHSHPTCLARPHQLGPHLTSTHQYQHYHHHSPTVAKEIKEHQTYSKQFLHPRYLSQYLFLLERSSPVNPLTWIPSSQVTRNSSYQHLGMGMADQLRGWYHYAEPSLADHLTDLLDTLKILEITEEMVGQSPDQGQHQVRPPHQDQLQRQQP